MASSVAWRARQRCCSSKAARSSVRSHSVRSRSRRVRDTLTPVAGVGGKGGDRDVRG